MVISAGKWRHLHVARIMLWKDKDHTYDILNNVEISGSHMIIQTLVRVVESMFVCISFHSIWIYMKLQALKMVLQSTMVLTCLESNAWIAMTLSYLLLLLLNIADLLSILYQYEDESYSLSLNSDTFVPPPSYALSRIRRNASHKHYLWKQAWKKLPCT